MNGAGYPPRPGRRPADGAPERPSDPIQGAPTHLQGSAQEVAEADRLPGLPGAISLRARQLADKTIARPSPATTVACAGALSATTGPRPASTSAVAAGLVTPFAGLTGSPFS